MYNYKYNKYIHKLSGGGSAPEPMINSESVSGPAPEPVPVVAPRQRSSIFSEGPNPAIYIFDCDYTIWPYDCNGNRFRDANPPFFCYEDGTVVDKYGKIINPYPNVPHILGALYDAGIQVAYASRNPSSNYVEELLKVIPLVSKTPGLKLWDCLCGRRDLFHAYSSGGTNNKLLHFSAIHAATGLTFTDMVFFDDGPINVSHAESIGIISSLLNQSTGLTWDAIDTVVGRWRQRLSQQVAAEQAAEEQIESEEIRRQDAEDEAEANRRGGGW
jgi:magnesium-dependent phosphatase 1